MFNLNTDLLVIDLEATAGVDENGNQTNNYIIDLGAVLLNKNLEIVSSFESLVKPEEEITEFITNLTKIDNDMVKDEDLFPEVSNRLLKWLVDSLEGRSIKKIRLCAWGTYFDIPLLRSVYSKYSLNYPFSGTSFDIKTMALMWHSLSGKKTDKLQVSTVAKEMGIKADGFYHRALTDALVETKILQRVWLDLQGFFLEDKTGVKHYNIVAN
ncbi:exonuclease domain-containing protein [Thiospirochaeta perfilievii]|uniref:Exonuclease domain-containing protein n=1 Tax=Thiospirochaeta perfilievii TaxID=252967 RepID=A0A5C1Q986_9SPIO|nr:3'-5' exonuclease [Thiospirochaeta perfilievii]QEN03938.1 exonuclease domain-containing protein [Thiospirochaeta perfilievii]